MPLRRLLWRFLRNRDAGVAPMMALAALPLFGFVGAAIDYSRAASVRTAMQAALDASALMLSKDAQTLTAATLAQKASDDFKAMFNRPEAYNVAGHARSSASRPQGNFALKMTASANGQHRVLQAAGRRPPCRLSASHRGAVGHQEAQPRARARQHRLDGVERQDDQPQDGGAQPAHHPEERRQDADGDVKVSIVPFATDVNAGTSNVNATWIDWTDWDAANGACSNTSYTTQSTCQSHSKTWTPAAHSTWNGCVNDRDQNNDVLEHRDRAGCAGDAVPRPPGRQLPDGDDAAVHRLDRAERQDRRDDADRQHQRHHRPRLGLGRSLSPVAPFNAPAPAPDLDKVIII